MSNFSAHGLRRRPDQTVAALNKLAREANNDQAQYLYSPDRKSVIIIGVQPTSTPNQVEFGIRQYNILGDALEEVRRLW